MVNIVTSRPASYQLTRHAAPGRPAARPEGGWVTDLAELEKCIVLCEAKCYRKFDPNPYGYKESRLSPNYNYVISDCDGCKAIFVKCKLFTKKR